MTANKIVLRAQKGKPLAPPENELYIEKCVSFLLRILETGFESGLNESRIENADETHLRVIWIIEKLCRFEETLTSSILM